MTRYWQQTIEYVTTGPDARIAERPCSRIPVDGPDAPILPRMVELLAQAKAEGLHDPVITIRATLS